MAGKPRRKIGQPNGGRVSSAGRDKRSRGEIFDAVENAGRARLEQSLKLFDESAVPEGLADRTCQKIWNAVDHPEYYAAEAGPIIPKFPRLVRSSKKGTPFILKTVSIREEDIPAPPIEETAVLPEIAVRTTDQEIAAPTVVSLTLDELKRSFAEQARHPRRKNRPRSPLLNGEIREELRDEYYWEVLPPETEAEKKRRLENRIKKSVAAATKTNDAPDPQGVFTETVTRIGHITLSSLRTATTWLEPEQKKPLVSEERNAPRTSRRRSRPTDLLISIVAGVLIAVVVVFPTLRLVGRELAIVIAKSTVRRIGQKVTVSADQSTLNLFPLWSEQILYPKSQEVEFDAAIDPTIDLTNDLSPSELSADESTPQ